MTPERLGALMAKIWSVPQHGRGRVDWAGKMIASESTGVMDEAIALSIVNNWRSSHSYPLQALKMTLRKRARKCDRKAIIAQRLKRLTSMAAKLRRNQNMQLSQMQDIGGCRAVVSSVKKVMRIVRLYRKSWGKSPSTRAEFLKEFDYIKHPKIDGYRGIHLVYKYRSESDRHRQWNGLRIEIQIRSKLQHAWATAVETVDAFTGQGLKVSGGTGTEKRDWGRFFALMSSAMALKEKTALVPDTPTDKKGLLQELKNISDRLCAIETLAGWSYTMTYLEEKAKSDDAVFIITLDTNQRIFNWVGFKKAEMKKAQETYLEKEKLIQSTPGVQVVLVSVDSMDAIRAAYPNYYADTHEFVSALEEAIENVENNGVSEVRSNDGGTTESSPQRDKEEIGAGESGKAEAQKV
jgi:hypothetical protein